MDELLKVYGILSFLVISGISLSSQSALAKSCGSARIVSGKACDELKVKFDLAGCGDASYPRDVKVVCHDHSASAILKTDLYRYNVELYSPHPGEGRPIWEVIGQPVQSNLDVEKAPTGEKSTSSDKIAEKGGEKGEEGEGRKLASLGLANPNPYAPKEAPGPGISFNLLFDGYYSYNFNKPSPASVDSSQAFFGLPQPNTSMRAYDFYHNSFMVNLVELTAKKSTKELTFLVDLDFGPQADFNAAILVPKDVGGPNVQSVDAVSKHLGQAVITYTPSWSPDLILEFGKMATHFGYEGWKSKDNWQYSRSNIFLFGIPLWHAGLHAGYSVVPKKLMLSGYLYNAWNFLYENNSKKSIGAQIKWTPSEELTVVYNLMSGPEQPGDDANMRTIHEANFSWTVNSDLTLALETLYGHESEVPVSDTSRIASADWMGAYVAAKYVLSPKYMISPRFEIYRDASGANLGGISQTLYGLTLTQSYKVTEGLESRLELRADSSTYAQRYTTGSGVSSNQTSVTLGVIYSTE